MESEYVPIKRTYIAKILELCEKNKEYAKQIKTELDELQNENCDLKARIEKLEKIIEEEQRNKLNDENSRRRNIIANKIHKIMQMQTRLNTVELTDILNDYNDQLKNFSNNPTHTEK